MGLSDAQEHIGSSLHQRYVKDPRSQTTYIKPLTEKVNVNVCFIEFNRKMLNWYFK